MSRSSCSALLVLAALYLSPSLAEADDCVVFHDVTVHGPDGPIAHASLVVRGQTIAAASAEPSGLEIDDGTARWKGEDCQLLPSPANGEITAGLIQVGTQLGLVEVGMESRTRHHDAGGDPVRADHRVTDSYNPRSSLIPIARLGGVTSAVIDPTGGMISGQSGWVDLAGDTQAEAVISSRVAVPASLSSPSPGAGMAALAGLLDDVKAFSRDRRAFDQNRTRELSASRRDLEAMIRCHQHGHPPCVAQL